MTFSPTHTSLTRLYAGILCLLLSLCACHKEPTSGGDPDPKPDPVTTVFAKGADCSWITQMEMEGKYLYDAQGHQTDCFTLLKSLGINSIRLRVWVNPSNGWCNKADFLVKAKRANAAGMRLLVNFHYSDSWADPAKQNKPAAWANYGITTLINAVGEHTKEVLNLLKISGITPEWVQIGNETGNGMLWEEGRASTNMKNYALLHNAGYNAVKAIFPNTKVMVHIHNGFDNGLSRWLLDGLKNNGAKWDVVGLSLYPEANNWQSLNDQCMNNVSDIIARYSKEVMICEVGMSWDQASACKSFLTDLITRSKAVSNSMCNGVFYWEPQCYGNWQNYSKGAFDNSGKPTIAMDAFKN